MDCSPPGSSLHGILQARILSRLPFPPPGDLPEPGIKPEAPALQADSLPSEPPGKRIVFLRYPKYGVDTGTKLCAECAFQLVLFRGSLERVLVTGVTGRQCALSRPGAWFCCLCHLGKSSSLSGSQVQASKEMPFQLSHSSLGKRPYLGILAHTHTHTHTRRPL